MRPVLRHMLFAVGAGTLVVAAFADDSDAAPPTPARIHQPGVQLERAVTDVVIACLRDDAGAALAGMERLEASCRRLTREESAALPRGVLVYDQALHTALERSRELVRSNHVTEGFDQFVWVMRACRQCHEMARRAGAGPAPAHDPAAPQGPSGN